MIITKPKYYDDFRCLAGSCPDSCCKEWDIQVDDEKATLYRSIPGDLGNRLREVLRDEDGETVMTIIDGRCPMWRADGLCRIQAELGEEALCKTCREFPRLTHDYGDFVELGLELSCPEAARIILSTDDPVAVMEEADGGDVPEYDGEAMAILLRTRETVRGILADKSHPVNEVLVLALMYGYQAQGELDGAEEAPFEPDATLAEAKAFAAAGDEKAILVFFRGLEILSPDWQQRLETPLGSDWVPEHLRIARYFADRYWLQAVSDYDLVSRVKLMVISCLLVRILGGDLLRTAQRYSKEIENSIENIEALLDAAYTDQAFTDDKLLGLLLQ